MLKHFQQMLVVYEADAADNGVLPVPANYNPIAQGIFNRVVLDHCGTPLLLAVLAFITLLLF